MKLNRSKLILCISLFMIFTITGCKSVTTASGEKVPLFKGTIIYDVEIVNQVDTSFVKNKKALFGTEMYLTVFRNGDIQRKYNGASINGYDLYYINIEENKVLEKYNNSDSLYVHSASEQNVKKVNNLKVNDDKVTVLDRELKSVAIAAQNAPSINSKGDYVTIKYWYDDALKIHKSKYGKVNDDLLNYFLNESDGSLYLKYEIDYFTYKVIYTAIEILPNKFEKEKEKINETVPQVED